MGSGVDGEKYERLIARLESRSAEYAERLLRWLEGLRTQEYFGVLEIKRLLPEEVWKRYLEFGEKNLREQVLLARAQRALRRAFNGTRPKTKSEVPAGDPDGLPVRPEGGGADGDRGGAEQPDVQ